MFRIFKSPGLFALAAGRALCERLLPAEVLRSR
jgi:hypothetical protein